MADGIFRSGLIGEQIQSLGRTPGVPGQYGRLLEIEMRLQ